MEELDESVTNGLDGEQFEEAEPATAGDDPDDEGDAESVEGYVVPQPSPAPGEFGPESAEIDDTMEHFKIDIGNASFGFGPESVHGIDDRRQITQTGNYPWRAHCSLLITAADNTNWIGTGWFVSPRLLITAGHVVFINGSSVPGQNGWVDRIRVVPGRNGSVKPYGEATSTRFYSVKGWTQNASQEYDYGAIVLDEPLGSQTGWFGFGVYGDDDLRGVTGNVSGYPGDKPSGTQWYAARKVDSVGPRKVFYDIDTAGGQSGSAVYRIKNGARYGIAVHAYGGATVNSGTRINRPVFDNIKQWKSNHP